MSKREEQKSKLAAAILAVAESAAELAVTQANDDAGGYERDCAYMTHSRASEQLEKAIDDIFGDDDAV
jgi:hypothetical protein